MFLDIEDAPFSIQNICRIGGKEPGEWYGPHSIARVMSTLVEEQSQALENL